jgi:hypothetical protein
MMLCTQQLLFAPIYLVICTNLDIQLLPSGCNHIEYSEKPGGSDVGKSFVSPLSYRHYS